MCVASTTQTFANSAVVASFFNNFHIDPSDAPSNRHANAGCVANNEGATNRVNIGVEGFGNNAVVTGNGVNHDSVVNRNSICQGVGSDVNGNDLTMSSNSLSATLEDQLLRSRTFSSSSTFSGANSNRSSVAAIMETANSIRYSAANVETANQ